MLLISHCYRSGPISKPALFSFNGIIQSAGRFPGLGLTARIGPMARFDMSFLPKFLGLSAIILASSSIATAQNPAPPKEIAMSHHARGSFEVKMQPLPTSEVPGVARFSIDKTIDGDLEATTKGEMYTAGDPKAGAAGYVAIEAVTGKLDNKTGGFVLQHFATMDATGPNMTVKIVPGSGTGELKGITGTFTIIIADGKHSYDLEYQLPATTP